MDVRLLFDGQLTWFRMYYKSLTNPQGNVYRIIGRLDDLENEEYIDVDGGQSGLCDVETHVLTFRTTFQFILQQLQLDNQGTLLLLNVAGLNKASETMQETSYQQLLQLIVRSLNNKITRTDLIGRFDSECFILFLHDTADESAASEKASYLLESIPPFLPDDKFKINIGMSLAGRQMLSLEGLINEANIALWQAMEEGSRTYRLFKENPPDI